MIRTVAEPVCQKKKDIGKNCNNQVSTTSVGQDPVCISTNSFHYQCTEEALKIQSVKLPFESQPLSPPHPVKTDVDMVHKAPLAPVRGPNSYSHSFPRWSNFLRKQVSIVYCPSLCTNKTRIQFSVLALMCIWFPVQACFRRFFPDPPVFPPPSKTGLLR